VVRSLIQLLEQDPSQKSGILDLFLHAKGGGKQAGGGAILFGEVEEEAAKRFIGLPSQPSREASSRPGLPVEMRRRVPGLLLRLVPCLSEEKQNGLGHLSMLLSAAALLSKSADLEHDKAAQKEMEQALAKCEAVSTHYHSPLSAPPAGAPSVGYTMRAVRWWKVYASISTV